MSEKKSWYSITAKDDKAEIDIFGHIGDWDVSAKDFIKDFRAIDAKEIVININSGGGDVFDGMAILDTIALSTAKTHAKIIGLAASMGSAIPMGADKVTMSENSSMMVHNARGIAMGQADDLRKTADLIDKENDKLANIYAKKTGLELSEIQDMMKEETWFTAEEAKAKGFIDSVDESVKIAATVDMSKYKKVYNNIPEDLLKSNSNQKPTNMDLLEQLKELGKTVKALVTPKEGDKVKEIKVLDDADVKEKITLLEKNIKTAVEVSNGNVDTIKDKDAEIETLKADLKTAEDKRDELQGKVDQNGGGQLPTGGNSDPDPRADGGKMSDADKIAAQFRGGITDAEKSMHDSIVKKEEKATA